MRQERKEFMTKHCFSLRCFASLRENSTKSRAKCARNAKSSMMKTLFSFALLCVSARKTQLNLALRTLRTQRIHDKTLFFFALLRVSARKTQLNLALSTLRTQRIHDKTLFFFTLLCVSARKTQLSLALSTLRTQRIHDETLFFFAFSASLREKLN